MLTLDGRCKTLDAAADGYIRADAVIILRLDALSGDDATKGSVMLRGTFVNQDGRSSSLTAPNGPSQQAVIRGALSAAGANHSDVRVLEMHGTGTPLGVQSCWAAVLRLCRPDHRALRLSCIVACDAWVGPAAQVGYASSGRHFRSPSCSQQESQCARRGLDAEYLPLLHPARR